MRSTPPTGDTITIKNWCLTILGISARCLQKALLILMNNYSWSPTKGFFVHGMQIYFLLCQWFLLPARAISRVSRAIFFFMFRSFVSPDFAENFTLLLMTILFQIFAVLKKFASVDPFATVTRTWLEQKRLRGKLENNGARAKIKENLVQPTDAF